MPRTAIATAVATVVAAALTVAAGAAALTPETGGAPQADPPPAAPGTAAPSVATPSVATPSATPPPAAPLPFAVRIVPPPVATPAASAVPAAATAQPLICRSTLQTGSLVARHRQCLTRAQWRYVDDAHETEARRLMMDDMTKPFCDAKC